MDRPVLHVLSSNFGLRIFRPGQQEAILHVLTKRDEAANLLCVMATGWGKVSGQLLLLTLASLQDLHLFSHQHILLV